MAEAVAIPRPGCAGSTKVRPLCASWLIRSALPCLLLNFQPAWAGSNAESELRLILETPQPGALVSESDERVFVSGRALHLATGVDTHPFEVVIALDTSASTRAPSGADVDGDGRTGRMPLQRVLPFIPRLFTLTSTDRGDSILAAEIEAVHTLLQQLDSSTTRVGVITFAGGTYDGPDSRVLIRPTHAYGEIEKALEELLEAGPAGMTNLAAALDVSRQAFQGSPRQEARRVVLLLTDGQATLPRQNAPATNAELALEAARRDEDQQIRVDVFAIGSVANEKPDTVAEIARITGGVLTPVEHPADLVATFRGISFASVRRVEVHNLTLSRPAEFVHLGADGSFSADLPLTPGLNHLRIDAWSIDGARESADLVVERTGSRPAAPLDTRMELRRVQMLEDRLDRERELRRALEGELREAQREEQLRHMEEVRQRRRELERKLEIRAEREPPPAAPQ